MTPARWAVRPSSPTRPLDDVRWPGGESRLAFGERVCAVLERI